MSKVFQYGVILCLAGFAIFAASGSRAAEQAAEAEGQKPSPQVIWRLLDYMAVDYAGAVEGGKVVSASEYAEMQEFVATAARKLAELPPAPGKDKLLDQAQRLTAAIAAKASPEEVARQAHALGDGLLAAYPVTMAPTAPPDMARGKKLYAENCESCHGLKGDGKGPNAEGLDPPPIAFTDRARAGERSVFGLYQVIFQGLDGTSMASYQWLGRDDIWALAFTVGQFAYTGEDVARGQKLWQDHPGLRKSFTNLEDVTKLSPAQLKGTLGHADAMALTAFLRAHPEAVLPSASGSLARTRVALDRMLEQYRAGDHDAARRLALSAYLDGFEPVEPVLSARDPALKLRIEAAMLDLRSLISRGASVAVVEAQTEHVRGLLDTADAALGAGDSSVTTSFVGAFTILLREGLEALLIVVAMIAFLRKAERTDVLPHVHGGWVAALVAGVGTWAAATWLVTISGASRELTEAFGGLLAAVVLVTVGIWMHGKSQSGAWQDYIHKKMSKALTRRSAWLLFLLAFVVVYREAFETILFFIALWSQGNGPAILAGAAAAVGVLGLSSWGLLYYSRRLPVAQFFRYSSYLMAVLAVVLAGKGVAAFQELGWLDVHPISWVPRVEMAGLFPTAQGLVVQVLIAAILIFAFWYNDRAGARSTA